MSRHCLEAKYLCQWLMTQDETFTLVMSSHDYGCLMSEEVKMN